ncbi:MAG: hypothetical protein AAFY81_09705 [Pseudomonadota bacterium]
MPKGKTIDPRAKRPDENDLQWRSRLAREDEAKRRKGEGIVTPETLAQGGLKSDFVWHGDTSARADTLRRQSRSSLSDMHSRGSITDEQLNSARTIAEIAEMIERNVRVGTSSVEARVDCSGSARDALFESLRMVRAEAAYSEWRVRLPLPRRLVIDMVIEDSGFKAIARRHNTKWADARERLLRALDDWPGVHDRYCRMIGREEIERRHEVLRKG